MRTCRAVSWVVAVAGAGHALAMVGAAASAGAPLPPGGQTGHAALYRCMPGTKVEIAALRLDLCDAEPTPLLAERAEPDNLQTRDGALVVKVGDGGIAAIAGVQPGDMIYRVAGVDVAGTAGAVQGLARVGADSDTQMNFLRRGRPYRIKLRR